MRHLIPHYKNKYVDGQVYASENELDVYNAAGEHVVALRKNGAGQISDESQAFGLSDRHDLAPIPKDARLFKHCPKGNVIKDELHDERKAKRAEFCDAKGRVKSCEELKAEGYDFDDAQRVRSKSK